MGSPGRSRRHRSRTPERKHRSRRDGSHSPDRKHRSRRTRSDSRSGSEDHGRRRRRGRGLETFDASAIPEPQAAQMVPEGGGQLVALGQGNQLVAAAAANQPLALVAPTVQNEKRRTKAAIARESRRVHVSHIPANISEEGLRDMFAAWCDDLRRKMIENETGKQLPPDAVLNIDRVNDIHLARAKAVPYAFVELTTDDMASRFIAEESSITFPLANGGIQKVGCRRPRDYTPMQEVSTRRVVLLGLQDPEDTAATMKQLFEACGTVEVFEVIPPSFPCPPGYYIEFETDKGASAAVASLNGEVIGQHAVVVQYATECVRWTLLNLGIGVTGMMGEEAHQSAREAQKDVMSEALNLQAPLAQVLRTYVESNDQLKAHWPAINPSRILALFNMFSPDDELNDEAAERELREVIEEELEKYGRLKRLIIPRDPPRVPEPPEPFEPRPKPVPEDFLDTPGMHGAAPETSNLRSAVGGGALIDSSGMGNPRFVEAMSQWEADKRHGEDKYQIDMLNYAKARGDWDIECLHPVHGVKARGRVFAEYETVDEAMEAQRCIAGRIFSGRTIITSFLYEDVLYPESDSDDEKEGPVPTKPADANAADADAPAPADDAPKGDEAVPQPDEDGGAEDID